MKVMNRRGRLVRNKRVQFFIDDQLSKEVKTSRDGYAVLDYAILLSSEMGSRRECFVQIGSQTVDCPEQIVLCGCDEDAASGLVICGGDREFESMYVAVPN